MAAPTVLIIDDHALFRSGIGAMLSVAIPGSRIIECGALDEALSTPGMAPDIVLLDVQLRAANGLDEIAPALRAWPAARIVVVSGLDAVGTEDEAIGRGAAAFLSKAERPERMIAILRDLLVSEGAAPPEAQRPLITSRQRDVLELMGEGLANKVIGRRLGVSEHTVRGHVQATLTALGASNRSEAVFIARRLGLLR